MSDLVEAAVGAVLIIPWMVYVAVDNRRRSQPGYWQRRTTQQAAAS